MSKPVGQAAPMRAQRARRVLLLGASGRLGSAIVSRLAQAPRESPFVAPAGESPTLTSSANEPPALVAPARDALALDLAHTACSVSRWFETWTPDVVINGIAASDVDACERDPARAQALNTELPAALALAAHAAGARLIHFSTDFVFDGALRRPYREDDPTAPLSVYGASKLAGERAIAEAGCRYWIFRISWLYGAARGNLAADLLDPANAGKTLRLADDRSGTPNPVQWLAAEVACCLARDAVATSEQAAPPAGLYHLSCRGATTWHAFGQAFLREAVRAGRLAPDRLPRLVAFREADAARPARRPAWSALDPSRYEQCFGRPVPTWESAIALAFG